MNSNTNSNKILNFKFKKHQRALDYALLQIKESPIFPYVKNIIVYGSCARGEEKWDSDLDLLLVTSDIVEKNDNLRMASRLLQGNCFLPGIDEAEVDMHIINISTWTNKNTTYLNEIRKDGIKL